MGWRSIGKTLLKGLGRLLKTVAKQEAQALVDHAARKGVRQVETKLKRKLGR